MVLRNESIQPSNGCSKTLTDMFTEVNKMKEQYSLLPHKIETVERCIMVVARGALQDAGVDITKLAGVPEFRVVEGGTVRITFQVDDTPEDEPHGG